MSLLKSLIILLSLTTILEAKQNSFESCDKNKFSIEDLSKNIEYDTNSLSKWYPSHDSRPKFLAMVVHGLNNHAGIMDDLGIFLSNRGGRVLRVSLRGFRGSVSENTKVNRQIWQKDIYNHYCLLWKEREKLGLSQVPFYFAGYSLGALSTLDTWGEDLETPMGFQAMALFSPAFKLHWYSHITDYLSWLGRDFFIKSFGIDEYRSLDGTSVASYGALHDMRRHLDREIWPENRNVPTRVFLSSQDEIVSFSKTKNMLDKRGLSKWRIFEVDNSQSLLKKTYHHMTMDRNSLGAEEWERVLEEISILFHFDN